MTFDEDIGSDLRSNIDDDDAMHLVHAAQIVHKEMFGKSICLMDLLSLHVNDMSYHHL